MARSCPRATPGAPRDRLLSMGRVAAAADVLQEVSTAGARAAAAGHNPDHSLRRKLCGCLFAIPESAPKLYSDKAYDFNDWEWHKNAAWRHRMEPWTFFLVASGFVWQLAHVLIASIIVGLYHEML
ncbi:uncharacterized protein HaLaN_31540, partial [Haematococcus lacustris]